jgi:hypothetical protein
MTKFAGVTTGVGRGVKGPAYSPPDIAGILARYTGLACPQNLYQWL